VSKWHIYPSQGGCGRTNLCCGRAEFIERLVSEQCLNCRDHLSRRDLLRSDAINATQQKPKNCDS
jgi:hypothetical protein